MNQVNAPNPKQGAGTIGQVLGAAHSLEDRLEKALGTVNLSLAKVGVLNILAEAKEPLTLGDLAERNQCVRSNITQLVDRLEADGLVQRVADPSDRRVRRASLTPAGRRASADGRRVLEAEEQAVTALLGRDGLPGLLATLGRLR